MSRVIKFRVWSENMNCWVENFIINQNGNIEVFAKYLPRSIEPNKKLILMQYTDLKDGNGVEIYEGDMLSSMGMDVVEAFYNTENSSFMFKVINLKEEGVYGNTFEGSYANVTNREVIGNVYENPELLK